MKKFLMMLAVIVPALAWGQGKAPEITAEAGDLSIGVTSTLTISLTNEGSEIYNGFQFDLYLPDGITLAKDNNNSFIYQFTDRYTSSGMSSSFRDLGKGWYRVICYSIKNVCITGNEGALMTLTLQAPEDLTPGERNGALSDVLLSRLDGKGIDCEGSEFSIKTDRIKRGDVNNDGEINLTDALMIVNYLLDRIDPRFIYVNADMDGGHEVLINDALIIINKYILGRE